MNEGKVTLFRQIQKIIQTGGLILLGILFLSFVIPVMLGYKSFIISSNSMQPALSTGDIVYVKSISFEDISVDDIVTFASPTDPSKTFTHRILQKIDSEELLITKGDANESMDPSPALYTNVVGKVYFNIPWFGSIIIFLRSVAGIVTLVGVFLTYVGFDTWIGYYEQTTRSKPVEGEDNGQV